MPDFRVYYDDGDYSGVSKIFAIDTFGSRFLVLDSYQNKFLWIDTKDCILEEDKKLITSKHWNGDVYDICQKVLTEVFGEGHIFGLDEYNIICTVIEKTLACVSENSDRYKINNDNDYVRASGFLMSQSAVREMTNDV